MFDIFGQIRGLIKSQSVNIDNNVFSLHYRFTVILLIVFSFIVGSSKYFGDPIDCTFSNKHVEHYADNYCWFNSYIIVPREHGEPYEDHVYPAQGSEGLKTLAEINVNSRYKPYFIRAYQWIEAILFLQAIVFFIPRYLWRYCWEQERVKGLTNDFNLVALKQDDDKTRIHDIAKYFQSHKFDHFEYAAKFTICEILNFVNVLTQFLVLRNQLDMHWTELWHDLTTSDSNYNVKSAISLVFPNLVRCDVLTTSGATVLHMPELCVLPINIFITKFYVILWFYFLGLTCISGLSLVYRLATIISPAFRTFLIKRSGRMLTDDCLGAIRNVGFGDWFILSLIAKNMDPFSFKNLVKEVNDSLVAHRPSFALVVNSLHQLPISADNLLTLTSLASDPNLLRNRSHDSLV